MNVYQHVDSFTVSLSLYFSSFSLGSLFFAIASFFSSSPDVEVISPTLSFERSKCCACYLALRAALPIIVDLVCSPINFISILVLPKSSSSAAC